MMTNFHCYRLKIKKMKKGRPHPGSSPLFFHFFIFQAIPIKIGHPIENDFRILQVPLVLKSDQNSNLTNRIFGHSAKVSRNHHMTPRGEPQRRIGCTCENEIPGCDYIVNVLSNAKNRILLSCLVFATEGCRIYLGHPVHEGLPLPLI